MINHKKLWNLTLATISYILLFFLIYEWLKPLEGLYYIIEVKWFLIFILLSLSIYMLVINRQIRFFINTGLTIVIAYKTTSEGLVPYLVWLKSFILGIQESLLAVFKREYIEMPNEVRSLLFLILLWVAISLIIYFHNKYKNRWFAVSTVVYLAVMDSFLLYDAKWAIIRVVVISLFLIVIDKQRQLNDEDRGRTTSIKLIIAATFFIPLIVSIGFVAPKAEAKWTDPFDFFSNFQGKGLIKVGGIKKVGYGDNDAYLGGSFKQDDTIVFETKSSRRLYWRGESKAIYTGHGWIDNEITSFVAPVKINGDIVNDFPYRLIASNSGLEMIEIKQELTFKEERFNNFFLGGDYTSILTDKVPSPASASAKYGSEKLYLDDELEQYQINGFVPIIDTDLLRKTNLSLTDKRINQYIQPYLQLPETLPARVRDLAVEITSEKDNQYDRVNAIKAYLLQNYEYNIDDIPVPKQNQDFVDQFLFESQKGYCDHFSSSMVVLSRSIGIPARWVKGFTSGELTYLGGEEGYKGVVRNNNAHSWVEVYFADIGWIPFEPTPSFTLTLPYRGDGELNQTTDGMEFNNSDNDLLDELYGTPVVNTILEGSNNNLENSKSNIFTIISVVISVILILAAAVALLFRNSIIYYLARRRTANESSTKNLIIHATEKMLCILERKKIGKKPSQTMREYLSQIFYGKKTDDWQQALSIFETARYSNNDISDSWRTKIWIVWKNIILKIRS